MNKIHSINRYLYFLLAVWLLGAGGSSKALANAANKQKPPLHRAAMQGDVEAIKSLLQKGARVDEKDARDYTPLVFAAAYGHTQVMELLLKAGARVDGYKRNTPLSMAAMHGHLENVRMLIDYGAKVNKIDRANCTPLSHAVMGGHLEIVQLLFKHKAKHRRIKAGKRFPLHLATQGEFLFIRKFCQHWLECERSNNHDKVMKYDDDTLCAPEEEVLAMVQCLLEHGARVNGKDSENETALYNAVAKQYPEVIKLLATYGAEINGMNKIGLCPLHYANIHGNTTVAQALIESGANVNGESSEGLTPLYVAISMKMPKMASFLFDKGASIFRSGSESMLFDSKYIADMQPFIWHVLEVGRNSNRNDDTFDYVLYNVLARRNLTMIKALLQQKKLHPNYRMKTANETVVERATLWGHTDTVQLLLEYEADIKTPVNAFGETLLHHAARRGIVKIAKLLIEHGADVNAKSRRGKTPLKYAMNYRHEAMIQLLTAHGAVVG